MPTRRRTVISRILISLIVAGLVALPGQATADEYPYGYGPFSDDNGSYHEEDIIALWAVGITEGCTETRFCPHSAVTRAQMATFLLRALPLEPVEEGPFTDVSASYHRTAINAIAARGITEGCTATEFCPKDPVSREQMATFLARALELEGLSEGPFTDIASSPHREAINAIAASGITLGCTPSAYCPAQVVSRAQMASFLVRAFGIPAVDPLPACSAEVCAADPYALVPAPPYSAEVWRDLVEYFFDPADVERAIQVIDCESNGDPNAHNAAIDASGLFQHLDLAWADRAVQAGFPGASIYDGVANTAAAAMLVYEGGGWDHWPVCG